MLLGRRDMSTEDRNRNLLLSGLWFGPVDGGIYNFLESSWRGWAHPPRS